MSKDDFQPDFGLKRVLVPIIGIIALIAIILIVGKTPSGFNANKPMKPADVTKKAIDFINTNLKSPDLPALNATDTKEVSGVYEFKLEADKEIKGTVYATKDGSLLFVQYINLDEKAAGEEQAAQPAKPVEKADKPNVKLFVMSYCPFGLQAEKMYLPVYELLKDKADMGIFYVDYLMHGEKELLQNINQYCIQKDQLDKFVSYMTCFVANGDHDKCAKDASVDLAKLKLCFNETDKEFGLTKEFDSSKEQFPKFPLHTDLCKQYNVLGSPTVVINGVEADISPRSPEKFKQVICDAFNTKPSECDTKLSETAASTGIGAGEAPATDAGSAGSCQ